MQLKMRWFALPAGIRVNGFNCVHSRCRLNLRAMPLVDYGLAFAIPARDTQPVECQEDTTNQSQERFMMSQLNQIARVAVIATLCTSGLAAEQPQQRFVISFNDDVATIKVSDGTSYSSIKAIGAAVSQRNLARNMPSPRTKDIGYGSQTILSVVPNLVFSGSTMSDTLICFLAPSEKGQRILISAPNDATLLYVMVIGQAVNSFGSPELVSREKFLAVAGEDKSTLPTIIRGGESRTDPMNDNSFGRDPFGADRRRDQLGADQVQDSLGVDPSFEQLSVHKLRVNGKGLAGVQQLKVGQTLQFEIFLTSVKREKLAKLDSAIFQIRGPNQVVHQSGTVDSQAIMEGGYLVVRFKCKLKQPVPAPADIVLIDAKRGLVSSVEYP